MQPWFEYDSSADALTIYLVDPKPGVSARTVEEAHGRLVDLDKQDRVVLIEVLEVSQGFFLDDLAKKYRIEDEIARVAPRLPAQFYQPVA